MNETSDSSPTEASTGGLAPGAAKPRADHRSDTGRVHPYRFLGVTVLALLGLLAMAGVKSYRDLAAAQDIERDLRRQIDATRARVLALTEHIDRIEHDPAMLERIAREELGMVRQGDVVIVLPEEALDDATEAAPETGLGPGAAAPEIDSRRRE